MAKRKVLILGASWFIGRNLFKFLPLNPNLEVWGTYHNNRFINSPNLIRADLDKEGVAMKITQNMDVVVHAAAYTTGAKEVKGSPELHVYPNNVMHPHLLDALHKNSIPHCIFLSCSVMYPPGKTPRKETDVDLNRIHPTYFGAAWMKVSTEKFCEFYSRLGRTKFTVIRHSNIYGPHDKFDLERSHVCGATITKVLTNTDGNITVWGDGSEERDLLYVSDLVNFIDRLVINGVTVPFDIVNVGLGKTIPVAGLVQKVIELSGKNIEIKFNTEKPTIPITIALDISKADSVYNWRPQVSLDEGLAKTIAWYKKNINPLLLH